MYITAATVDGQVVTSAQLDTFTNTNTIVECSGNAQCKQHPNSNTWANETTTTTTAFPYPVWATNTTSTSPGLCNLYLSNAGGLTVNNTYAETVWSIGGKCHLTIRVMDVELKRNKLKGCASNHRKGEGVVAHG
jgi:hypothetical protein